MYYAELHEFLACVQFIALITSFVLCELSGNLEEIQKLSAESDFDVNETSKYNVCELL